MSRVQRGYIVGESPSFYVIKLEGSGRHEIVQRTDPRIIRPPKKPETRKL